MPIPRVRSVGDVDDYVPVAGVPRDEDPKRKPSPDPDGCRHLASNEPA